MDKTVLIESDFGGTYRCRITDCMGRPCGTCTVDLSHTARLSVPVNGYLYLERE